MSTPIRDSIGWLFRRGPIYTIALAGQVVSSLLVLPIVTRILDDNQYGIYVTGALTTRLAAIAAVAGIPAAITVFYFREPGGDRASRQLVVATMGFAVAFCLIADLTGPWWSTVFANVSFGSVLRVAVWSALPFGLVTATQEVLRAADRAAAFLWIGVLSTLGAQILGLVGAIWMANALGYLGGIGVGYVIAALAGLLTLRGFPRQLPSTRLVRAALRLGVPTIPHGLAMYALAVGDRVIIERLMGLDRVGRYQVAYLVGSIGISLVAAFNNAWAPQIYGADDENRWELLAASSAVVFRVSAYITAAVVFASPVLLAVAAPSSYDPASLTPVTALVAGAVLPYVAYLSAVHAIFQRGKTQILLIAAPLAVVANLSLNLMLIPPLGLKGAAAATVVAYALLALIVLIRVRRLQIPWQTGHMFRSWTGTAAAVAIAVFMHPVADISIVVFTVAAVVCGVMAISSIRRLAK